MGSDRLRKIEELYHLAKALTPEQRRELLAQSDPELRGEVESLIAQENGDNPLDRPAMEVAAKLLKDPSIEGLTVGEQLGPYKIEGLLGAGGMGQVYKARDTRLGRTVAIKVLLQEFSRRFEREARAISSLNHPNICTLHDVGLNYLVMELVEGVTLADRIKAGALPLNEALGIARQIAGALEAAHEKGIVHRDLKPANIKVKPDGTVKVLDFGLATITQYATAETRADTAETQTQPGMVVGTAAYMSPEQAMAKPVDKRGDIWSFGAILWELLAGRRLFQGETVSQTLAHVINGPIDVDNLAIKIPTAIRDLLRRCLDRDPNTRLRDIGEARIAIDLVLTDKAPVLKDPSRTSLHQPRLAWSMSAVLAIAVAAVAFLVFRQGHRMPAPVRVQIPLPENTPAGALLSLSPDGRKLAFVTQGRLWVYSLETGESRDLAVATGTPFWSPDGRFIGYSNAGKLQQIASNGGPTQMVTEYKNSWGGGTWNQENIIVFSDRSGLFRVPASGGDPVRITAAEPLQESGHAFPFFLPDGHHFLYTRFARDLTKSAFYVGSLDARPEQQPLKALVRSVGPSEYTPSTSSRFGYLLFVREGTLVAQPFDSQRFELSGKPAPVSDGVSDYRAFSVSNSDVIVFQRSSSASKEGVFNRIGQFTWYDRAGKVVGTVAEPDEYRGVALSPDQKRLAAILRNANRSGIWLFDLSGPGGGSRFTFGPGYESNPVWSPDGKSIVFSSNRNGPFDLYEKPVTGDQAEVPLLKSTSDKHSTSWSRDGRFLLYTSRSDGKSQIWVLPLFGDRKPVRFSTTAFNEQLAQFSPDGRLVAYTSDESGRRAVWVRSFLTDSSNRVVETGGKWQICSYGHLPRWRSDGKELYYLSLEADKTGTAMAVKVDTDPVFRAGTPQPLPMSTINDVWDFWDVADGNRFLLMAAKDRPAPYTLVLNWQSGMPPIALK